MHKHFKLKNVSLTETSPFTILVHWQLRQFVYADERYWACFGTWSQWHVVLTIAIIREKECFAPKESCPPIQVDHFARVYRKVIPKGHIASRFFSSNTASVSFLRVGSRKVKSLMTVKRLWLLLPIYPSV